MLTTATIIPSSFEDNQHDELLYPFDLIILLLRQLEKNSILLVDMGKVIESDIDRNIRNWPESQDQYRTKAMSLLKNMKTSKRIVSIPFMNGLNQISTGNNTCKKPCQIVKQIHTQECSKFLLSRSSCYECLNENFTNISENTGIIAIDDFAMNDKFHELMAHSGCFIDKTSWDQIRLKREILVPIFQYAKSIKFIDKILGRAVLQENWCNFEAVLIWMIEVLISSSRVKKIEHIEFYTSPPEKYNFPKTNQGRYSINNLNKKTALTRLERLEKNINNLVGYECFKFYFKPYKEMPHDRFILTDQISLSLGTGIELFKAQEPYPRQLKDCTVSCEKEYKKNGHRVRTLNGFELRQWISNLS